MTLLADPSLAALVDVARGLVFVIFVLCALLLMLVVLIQEGKGGGLGSAFGGAAADAFGVKAGTVNRFTTWLAMGFLSLALLHAGLSSSGEQKSMVPTPKTSGIEPSGDPAVSPGDQPEGTPPPDGTAPDEGAPPDEGTTPDEGRAPDDGATPPAPPDDAGGGDPDPPDDTGDGGND